jgi:hypothetical protein
MCPDEILSNRFLVGLTGGDVSVLIGVNAAFG